MPNDLKLNPINSIYFVTEDEYQIIDPNEIKIEIFGEKAYGLASIPSKWSLPFIVVSAEMFNTYKTDKDLLSIEKKWGNRIRKALERCGISTSDMLMVRSNACCEGLNERGKYTSEMGEYSLWPRLIKECFDDFISQGEASFTSMPIIIQKAIVPLLKGHISNERRVSNELRDWRGEMEVSPPANFNIALRNWREKINFEKCLENELTCISEKQIKSTLKILCSWASAQKLRIHFEWIFDGQRIYVVQSDMETPSKGINPYILRLNEAVVTSNFRPQCLHTLLEGDRIKYKKFNKIHNPLLYKRLGLNIAPLYILDDHKTLLELYNGVLSLDLESDLKELTKESMVIRTDIDSDLKEERQLLPRTCEIRTLEEAVKWLKEQYRKIKDGTSHNIIFIFHNFIPAYSSAFAYADPNTQEVMIESLWGLPEGLYYYAHDKYKVDTGTKEVENLIIKKFKIDKKINYKKYFVFPKKDGEWKVEILSDPYDWEETIQKEEWINEIALATKRIAAAEAKSISVMWFVDVCSARIKCKVFPWHHEPYQYKPTRNIPRHKLSFERNLIIHTRENIDQLENVTGTSGIKSILIQPTDAEILRDKDIITRIGKKACSLGATIILEGGILSHAYYQLIRTGAKVEVKEPFDKMQTLKVNKLVRDGIPEKIEMNGEQVITERIESDMLIGLLKRKLVEEALEVFDADRKDEVLKEIADVMEVLDGLILQLGVNKNEVEQIKNEKKRKVGGFENGVYLRETFDSNVGYEAEEGIDREPIHLNSKMKKSTDIRRSSTSEEMLFKLKIPVDIDKWEVRPTLKRANIDIMLKGKREKGIIHIDLSVFKKVEQLSLYF